MARDTHTLTFEVTFFNGEEIKPVVMTIGTNLVDFDDPKEAAIAHIACSLTEADAEFLQGYNPKFRTFRVLHFAKMSDTAW